MGESEIEKLLAVPATGVVGVIMGSRSDWPTMQKAVEVLDTLGIGCEKWIVSAHRSPQWMAAYAQRAAARGLKLIIAGAGGAAHLPGMVSAYTHLPVLGVPIKSRILHGIDSLLSIVQMPAGVPTATLAIGEAGAINAALLAARILALSDRALEGRLLAAMAEQQAAVLAQASDPAAPPPEG